MNYILLSVSNREWIAIISLLASILALTVSYKTHMLSTYKDRAKVNVFLKPTTSILPLFLNWDITKVYLTKQSHLSVKCDFKIMIESKIGGIYRVTSFDFELGQNHLGIRKSGPIYRHPKKSKFRSLAYKHKFKLYGNPWRSYFEIDGEIDRKTGKPIERLNRYASYIQIEDYCGNMEIWYIAFSIILSNYEPADKSWREVSDQKFYWRYYTFSNVTVVSPSDIPSNISRIKTFEKDLKDIMTEQSGFPSPNSMGKGIMFINSDLEKREMREYIKLLNEINTHNL